MNCYFVYCYYENQVPFYVGMGAKVRHLNHLKLVRSGKHLKNKHFEHKLIKILESGREPIIEKVVEGLSEFKAKQIEKELIAKYGRADLGRGPLVNLTDGGDGRCSSGWSESQKKYYSELFKGRIGVIDNEGNKFQTTAADPRWISGELRGHNTGITFNDSSAFKGLIQAKDKITGKHFRVKTDDPRWVLGTLVGTNSGKKLSTEVKKQISETMKQRLRDNPRGKACTVDDKTFFKSLKELTATLGKGKHGARHPNFRYV